MFELSTRPTGTKFLRWGVFTLCFGSIFVVGVMLGAELTPRQLVGKLYSKFQEPGDTELAQVSSVFFPISLSYQDIPRKRDGGGGGLTSYQGKILLLTHDGRFFSSTRQSTPELLPIEAPENHLSAYQTLSEEGEYLVVPSHLRYNDILYYQLGRESGLIISYTEYDPRQRCFTSSLAKLTVNTDAPPSRWNAKSSDWHVFYRTTPCLALKKRSRAIEGHIAGGRLDWLDEGKLLFASGDYSRDGIYGNPVVAQDPTKEYGKIIEVDIISGNSRIVSTGHRNPQGVLVDNAGNIWVTEHGMRGGDELNFIEQGKNYGWPLETLGTLYSMEPVPGVLSYGRHEEFAAPAYSWVPSVGLSNIVQIENFHNSWDGDLLAASLAKSSLYRLRVRDRRVVFSEPIEIPGKRIRYVHQHDGGELVLWTDTYQLIYMSALKPNYTAQKTTHILDNMGLENSDRHALTELMSSCMECHSFDANNNEKAPSLGNIFDREIGKSAYKRYSEVLLRTNGRWDRKNLALLLKDSSSLVRGSSMPSHSIRNEKTVENFVEFLKRYSETIEL